jgi:hypothetical protein
MSSWIFEHYRELATEAEADAWFAVRPDKSRLEFLKAAETARINATPCSPIRCRK